MTVIETYAGTTGDATCTNAVTQVVLDEGAQVEHYKIQDEPETAFHLALLDVRQGPDSRFSSGSVALGSKIARNEVHVRLEGEGAKVSIDGLYLPRGDQHHDNPILIEHAAPRCTSRQLYKGIVDEHGHGVFNGRIIVWPDAFGTDASQTNKNLLLSDHAEVDTRPRLEIFTDDVKCTHGAAVGALDEEALFYLRSRGVPHQAARALLTYAFAREMLDLIPSRVVSHPRGNPGRRPALDERRRDRGHTPVSSDLVGMYQQVIIDHGRSPHNFRKPEDATRTAQGVNPLVATRSTIWS